MLCISTHVLDVVGRQTLDRILVGTDGALHLGLENVFIFLTHHGQKLLVFLLQLFIRNQRMMAQPFLKLVHHHERIDRLIELRLLADQSVRNLVLNVSR